MVRSTVTRSKVSVQSVIEQIMAAGQMSREQHVLLTSAVLADQHITDDDRRQINRLFDYVQIGRLRLVDLLD